MRRLQVVVALLALSAAQYWLVYAIITYGSVHFYHPVEHAMIFGYCVASYAACRLCDRVLRGWPALLASYPVAAAGTLAVFAASRLAGGMQIGVALVLEELPFQMLMFHSIVAGAYFAIRHIDALAARAAAERAAEQAELRRLQQQVDPHFLFNNLNILTALVRHDPDGAEQLGHHLAQLYRYLVQHNRREWVELADELAFAESYLHVITARFGAAYRLHIALPPRAAFVVLPGALQELLGNIVKHNHASAAEPIDAELRLEDDTLVVDSALRPKPHAGPSSGQGLALLDERCRRQAGRPVAWAARGGRFVVRVPLVAAR